jgi:hypothetical protein
MTLTPRLTKGPKVEAYPWTWSQSASAYWLWAPPGAAAFRGLIDLPPTRKIFHLIRLLWIEPRSPMITITMERMLSSQVVLHEETAQ